jgi:uncharacterized protein YciI
MKTTQYLVAVLTLTLASTVSAVAQMAKSPEMPKYDANLAKQFGADDYGMKNYVFCILKTGPNDAKVKGRERDDIFAGHMKNIGRLAAEGKLAIAGPFGDNDKSYRGLFIFNVTTVEEARQLVETDPTVKAGVLIAELTPWYGSASLMATPELHKKIQKKQF